MASSIPANASALGAYIDTQASRVNTLDSLIQVIHDWAIKQEAALRAMIDTPEERAAFEQIVLKAFDKYVAPKLGPVASVVRMILASGMDALLVGFAGALP